MRLGLDRTMHSSSKPISDIAVIGGGPAGLTAALAMRTAGFSVALAAPAAKPMKGRTVALFDGSVIMLKMLGLWPQLEPKSGPMERMTLIDDTGSLFRPLPVTFSASEIGLDLFGWNIDAGDLVRVLDESVCRDAGIQLHRQTAEAMTWREDCVVMRLADGSEIAARMVIAADGQRSSVRDWCGIGAKEWSYPQMALTTVLTHLRGHQDTSTEFHTREGPFTLVPLPGRRSSLVWVMAPERADELMALDDAALGARISAQAKYMLGEMTIDGPRGLVPMRWLRAEKLTGLRVALIGETAHAFPPIGAQGLNLTLRDIATLVDCLEAHGCTQGALDAYAAARRTDVLSRTLSVDLLNRTLLSDFLPADFLRGAGLMALDMIGPLRRFVMKQGLAPPGKRPRLMQAAG